MNKKSRVENAVLVVLIGLVLTASVALAQSNTWVGEELARVVDGARWRIGELRVNAAFSLANAGYDSDIYFGYFQNTKTPDWTLTAAVPVQVLIPLSKRVVLDVSDAPQYLFYLDTKKERAWNNVFQSRIHVALDRIYVQGGVDSANVRRRLSPELDINVRERTDSLNGLVFWQAAQETSFAVVYNRTRFDYGDAEYSGTRLSDVLNRNEDFVNLVAYAQPHPRWRPFLNGQYGVYTFTNQAFGLRDAKSYGIFGGVEFVRRPAETEVRRALQGSFRLGYMRLEMVDPSQRDGSGFSAEANVTLEVTGRTSFHALFSRGFEFSVYSGASYYLGTGYGGGIVQRLSRRTSLAYDVLMGSLSYPENTETQGLSGRYGLHTLSLSIRMARNLEATLSGSLNNRKLGVDTAYRSRYFVGFSLLYGSQSSAMALPLGSLVR